MTHSCPGPFAFVRRVKTIFLPSGDLVAWSSSQVPATSRPEIWVSCCVGSVPLGLINQIRLFLVKTTAFAGSSPTVYEAVEGA